MSDISLSPMTQDEFDDYLPPSIERYKNDKMRANNLTAEEANKIAHGDFERVLPDGLQSKNNFLFSLTNGEGKKVGTIWYCIRGEKNNQKAFIAEIFINESERGRGYGKAAMLAIEAHAKSQQLNNIELHVFGFNEAAIKLYRSLGYETTDLSMAKKVGSSGI